MPTTFTHDLFGRDVYRNLSGKLQEKVRRHGDLYRIGLHGPDILFYYRVVKTEVSRLGNQMHTEEAKAFFERGLWRAKREGDEALFVYLLGFACHFLLDSVCHPYIQTLTDAHVASHGKIEKEWDRLLLLKEGRDPWHFYPARAIKAKREYAEVIGKAIPEVSPVKIEETLKWMKMATNAMVYDDGGRKQRVLLPLLGLAGLKESIGDHFMRRDRDMRLTPMLETLEGLYGQALEEAPPMLEALWAVYKEGKEVPDRFRRNYC